MVGFFFFVRGMARFLKPRELQVFQGPKVNRGYNITTNGAGCLVLAKLFVTSVFEKQNQSEFCDLKKVSMRMACSLHIANESYAKTLSLPNA